jgi:NitT/TauT family transport system permease protein
VTAVEDTASGLAMAADPFAVVAAPGVRRTNGAWLPSLLIIIVGLAWELSVRLFSLPAYLLPKPLDVLARIGHDYPTFLHNGWATLQVILIGFGCSALLGVALALVVVLNGWAERVLMPLIVGTQTVPMIAIAPLFVVWLGFGIAPKVLVTFLISFFPVVISTAAGLRAVEPDMIDLVRSMGATGLRVLLKVRIPTALPQMFSGFKIAITSAVIGAIVAEFVGSDSGLGYLLVTSTATMDGPLIWSALLILIVMGVLLFALTAQIERLVIPWHVSVRTKR